MKKVYSVVMAAAMASVLACAPVFALVEPLSTAEAPADSDVAYIQEKGTFVVGITDFAPMDYKDENGEWTGFDAELAAKVAEDLGVEVEFLEIDWSGKVLELQSRNIDAVWNGMTLTPEVTEQMNCTEPYCANTQVVVMNAEKAEAYTDLESLSELTFAVESGSAGEAAAEENGLECTPLQTQADALMEVFSGTSDACIIDRVMAAAMTGEGTDYPDLVYTIDLTEEEYGIGCRPGSDLTDYINAEMDKFSEDGTLASLADKYGLKLIESGEDAASYVEDVESSAA